MPSGFGRTYEPVKLGRVRNLSRVKVFPTNHSEDHQLENAKKLVAEWKPPEDTERYMYIPSQRGYDHGGYSADSCVFAPGAGEKLASEYVHMLYELFDRDEAKRY